MAETKVVSGVPTGTTYGVPGTEQVVDPTFGAARVSLKPTEVASQGLVGGHFQLTSQTGALTGLSAASPIFSFRWSPPNGAVPYCIVKKVQVAASLTTVFTTAQTVDFDLMIYRAWTSSDSGGTTLTPLGNNSQKMRSQFFAVSNLAYAGIATTGTLTAGGKTADQYAIASAPIVFPITTASGGVGESAGTPIDLFKEDAVGQHPLMFGANEGFSIRNVTAMGAAGVLKVYVTVAWAEVPGL